MCSGAHAQYNQGQNSGYYSILHKKRNKCALPKWSFKTCTSVVKENHITFIPFGPFLTKFSNKHSGVILDANCCHI